MGSSDKVITTPKQINKYSLYVAAHCVIYEEFKTMLCLVRGIQYSSITGTCGLLSEFRCQNFYVIFMSHIWIYE